MPSDVTDYWVLRQNSPSVESGSGGAQVVFQPNPAIFVEYQKCLWLKNSTHEVAFHT